jgi:hypothetical protein
MYAGHAAIALLAKGTRPSLPLAVLVPVAFGPDWIEWLLVVWGRPDPMASHSIVSVFLCATLVAAIYWAFTRSRGDAAIVWLTYFSHWPADFITGMKPTWPGGPYVGLGVYGDPIADIVGESAVIIICYIVYRRSLPPGNQNRWLGLLIPLGLIAMQIGFYAIQKPEVKEPLRQIIGEAGVLSASWSAPDARSLAALGMTTKALDNYFAAFSSPRRRMSLATLARESNASESWPTTKAHAVS